MIIRLLAFALHADERLRFTKGLSTEEEPDLWRKSLSDNIKLWIELGLPSAKRLKKACGRGQQVIVYTYGTGPPTNGGNRYHLKSPDLVISVSITLTATSPQGYPHYKPPFCPSSEAPYPKAPHMFVVRVTVFAVVPAQIALMRAA